MTIVLGFLIGWLLTACIVGPLVESKRIADRINGLSGKSGRTSTCEKRAVFFGRRTETEHSLPGNSMAHNFSIFGAVTNL